MNNNNKPISALFVGLGSIGCRHLKNLRSLCAQRGEPLTVTALRSSPRPLRGDIAPLVDVETQQLPSTAHYDLAFITNPTHLHAEALAALRGKVDAFFIEKPIFSHTNVDLAEAGLPETQKAYVAAPLRWTALYQAIKAQAAKRKVYSARAICSSYLPDWRKDVDYRQNYSAHRDQGGGVALDLIHEWDYLADLFGLPQASCHMAGKFSELEINSDDIAVYIARYPNLLCELHLDYFGREYRRTLELFCPEGTLTADFGTGRLTLPDGETLNFAEDVNRRFEREMAYFLDYAQAGGQSANSPRHAMNVLKIALGE